MSASFAYYPGCSLHGTSREFDMSVKAVCGRLGVELEEMEDWVCCGATPAHAVNPKLALALSVRNLSIAEKMGKDVAVACAACFNRMKAANKHIEGHEELLEHVNRLAGADYKGGTGVQHIITILKQLPPGHIEKAIVKKLEGLKVACYYGCLLLRPPKVMEFDDAENPTIMESLLSLTGAEMVDWNFKTECCGATLSVPRTEIVLKLCNDILGDAKSRGADVIAVACPLCQLNLDWRQAEVEKAYGVSYRIPVMYFAQILGLALGAPPAELGLSKLIVSPGGALKEKNLA